MPPRRFSRYTFTEATRFDDLGEEDLFIVERDPFPFVQRADNRIHVIQEGDTLQALAGSHYRQFRRPAGLWWVIADFQPQPIHDPTLRLVPGVVLIIPSPRTVEEEIFDESRRTRRLS